jgi:hypothetical protein
MAHSPIWHSGFWTWGGWSFFVATGTLGLAFFTWRAVRKSSDQIKLQTREVDSVEKQTTALTDQTQAVREQAEATKRQVDISIASLEAASRPVLVGLVEGLDWRPTRERDALREKITLAYMGHHEASVFSDAIHYEVADDMIYCSVPLRNVGAGVAFLQRVELVTTHGSDFPLQGRVTEPVVPRDETTRTLFAAVRKQSDGKASDWEEIVGIPGRGFAQFTIRVVYTGASRELVTVTELTTSQLPTGGFIYTGQQVWTGEGIDRQLLVSTDNIAT